MSDLTKTNFLGVIIDTENGSSNPKINKSLNKSLTLLDIMKFIEVTKFKLLEWFGYEGEYRKQRQNFKKMLQNNNIEYRELTWEDEEIEQFPTFQQELQLLPHDAARACSKFLIMEPRDLKMAIMQLKTKNGHIIRDYYIDLEELLKLY